MTNDELIDLERRVVKAKELTKLIEKINWVISQLKLEAPKLVATVDGRDIIDQLGPLGGYAQGRRALVEILLTGLKSHLGKYEKELKES
jgi:hypothetical protein